MKIYQHIKEIQKAAMSTRMEGKTIGFVPTMGYLHEGHLQLVKEARENHDIVVMSIFVNPLQFGPNEDFDKYPRDFERDEELAKQAGVDWLFYPSVNEMYPQKPTIIASVTQKTNVLCGNNRPGHFDGVATVVLKLFNIVQPNKAYFGQKDAQQVAILHSLVEDFNLPLSIVEVPTVREEDGLAKSSRNVHLSDEERAEAPNIYKGLIMAKEAILAGETNPSKIIELIQGFYQQELQGETDYIELYAYPELLPIEKIQGKIIIAVAHRYSRARLIDNIQIETNIK